MLKRNFKLRRANSDHRKLYPGASSLSRFQFSHLDDSRSSILLGQHVMRCANCDGEGRLRLHGRRILSAPIAVIDGEYAYKGSTKLGGPIANVSGGGRMSAAAAAICLLLM